MSKHSLQSPLRIFNIFFVIYPRHKKNFKFTEAIDPPATSELNGPKIIHGAECSVHCTRRDHNKILTNNPRTIHPMQTIGLRAFG